MTGGNLQQWTNGTSRLLEMPMVGSRYSNSGVNCHDYVHGMQILLCHQMSHILLSLSVVLILLCC